MTEWYTDGIADEFDEYGSVPAEIGDYIGEPAGTWYTESEFHGLGRYDC